VNKKNTKRVGRRDEDDVKEKEVVVGFPVAPTFHLGIIVIIIVKVCSLDRVTIGNNNNVYIGMWILKWQKKESILEESSGKWGEQKVGISIGFGK